MLKSSLPILAIALLLCLKVAAQSGFEFTEDKHDFGVVEEYNPDTKIGANPIWQFKFKNVGKDTILLSINDVKVQCGCTTPSISTEPIPPGGTGYISTMYNSYHRLGAFNKMVTVLYKGEEVKKLYFKGVVVARDTTKYSGAELKKSAVFFADKYSFDLGKAENGQKITQVVNIKNTGKDTLKILSFQSACYCIEARLKVDTKELKNIEVDGIAPGKSGRLELYYTVNGEGPITDVVTLSTTDKINRAIKFTLNAEIVKSLLDKSPVPIDGNKNPFDK